jgi:L-lactate utilization protein LutC
VANRKDAVAAVSDLVRRFSARKVLLASRSFIDSLGFPDALSQLGVEVVSASTTGAGPGREDFFAADIGITGVHALIAETGTLVLSSRPDEPRSLSLLPPIHIAVAHQSQLVADLFDLFEKTFQPFIGSFPSCISMITGPSKTGDIELRLVTGVHGPGELHVVLVAG